MENHIRNFCIIAHVDHGKSTLADRFLELTGTVEKRMMKDQFLDQMELEREKGITIKMQPVRMLWHPDRRQNADSTQNNAENFSYPNRRNTQNQTQKDAEHDFLYEDLTYKVRGILFQVRKNLGLGHKEQVYHNALEIEFQKAGLNFQSKKNIPIVYEGKNIGMYQPDFVLDDKILLELKALPEIGKPQTEQLWSYLKGCDYKLALLVNFGSKDLEIKRVVYDLARLRNSALSLRDQRDSEPYVLNLIDTPGHVDFSYEVSRSLAAVEGAILLVDATKGIQAQTLANVKLAKAQNVRIIPAINKVDLPTARIQEVSREIALLLGVGEHEIFQISAKTGYQVEELLRQVIRQVPPAKEQREAPLRALIFDSRFDPFKGVVAYVRVKEGRVQTNDRIVFKASSSHALAKEVGYFAPKEVPSSILGAGEIGYIATGLKDPEDVRIGDTVTLQGQSFVEALEGYETPLPVVFVSFYPENPDGFDILKDALAKLKLNDPSFEYAPESHEALGRGFRCGFLGLLHSEIISERVRREFQVSLVISRPSVEFKVLDRKGKEYSVKTAADWPAPHLIEEAKEPWVLLDVITPVGYISKIIQLLQTLEGKHLETNNLGENTLLLIYETPLREIIIDFYDKLKSVSQGMASMDYEIADWRKADLIKLEILIAGEREEAFSQVVPQEKAYREGKAMVEKLKELLPPQLFAVSLQAAIGGKVIARETMKARRRDVTAPLYGGDVTRKRKLLEKQKKGKKELKEKGRVHIPSKVFLDVFRS